MLENFNDFKFILLGETNVQEREDPVSAFAKVKTKLKQADLLFGHMEGLLYPPTINSDVNDLPFKEGWKHSEPGMVNAFIDAGFDVVSNASNVAYGSEAIESTIETLEKSGIKYCGIGRNIEEAKSPTIVEKRGLKFGFLSYTSVFWPTGMEAGSARAGVSTISAKTYYQPHKRTIEMPGVPPIVRTEPDSKQVKDMEASIEKLKKEVDIIVVSCHWGVSGSETISDYQQIIARKAIEAGADIIIGHHPHVIQPIEVYQGKLVCYSLGNFAFDWYKKRYKQKDGLMLECMIKDKKICKIGFKPARRNEQNQIELLNPLEGKGKEIVNRVIRLSKGFGTEFTKEEDIVLVNGYMRDETFLAGC